MSEPEPKEPSILKKTRDDVLAAIRKLVEDSAHLPPAERAAVLREAATAIATIDDAMTRNRAVFIDAEFRKLQR